MKNFDEWSEIKKKANAMDIKVKARQGEIWVCSIGVNIGFEIDGKHEFFERPVLVITSFGRGGSIVLPLTSKNKKSNFLVSVGKFGMVNITQIRYLDSRRFLRYTGFIERRYLVDVVTSLIKLISLNKKSP